MKKYITPEIIETKIFYTLALCASPTGNKITQGAGDIQGSGTQMAPGRTIYL